MKKLHNALEEKIKKAERLPKSTPTDLSNLYTKDEVDSLISSLGSGNVSSGTGTTAERPSTLTIADTMKYIYYDTDTQGVIFWIGDRWSDQ